MNAPALVRIGRPTLASGDGDAQLELLDPDADAVNAMDLGITRGDGVFETVGIHRGVVHSEQAHLDRFARSAAMMELPAPDPEAYRAAVALGVDQLGDVDDLYCKYVLTRGRESVTGSAPTGYAFVDVNPDFTAARTTGITVVTLSRGYALDVTDVAPWLLQGVKYLSYAINRSVLREAARRDADDVLFLTTDGYVLEGPTSSLVLRFGDRFVTPDPARGVLAGTAQGAFFEVCERAGFATEYRVVRAEELAEADQMWLTNSQRLAAPIRHLDGVERAVDDVFTARMNDALRNRVR